MTIVAVDLGAARRLDLDGRLRPGLSGGLLALTGSGLVLPAAAGVVDGAAPCDDGADDDAADEPNGLQPAVSSAATSTDGSSAARDSGRCSLIGPVSAAAVSRGAA